MDDIRQLIDLFLHVDVHLSALMQAYGFWIYAILFGIIFLETGLVITPFLPGDSLLFAAGALIAVSDFNIHLLVGLLIVAAVLGDGLNYSIGRYLGPKVFRAEKSFLFNPSHLLRAQSFYEKYGAKTIVIARFMPIIRTFAPFVAGIGQMNYSRFFIYNVIGGALWISSLSYAGYLLGEIPFVRKNFSALVLLIVFISCLPPVFEYLKSRKMAHL